MTRGLWLKPIVFVVLCWLGAGAALAGESGMPAAQPDSGRMLLAMGSVPKRTVTLSPGTVFRDCRTCPEMVVIGPGRFEMGAAPGEEVNEQIPGRYQARSRPRHEVTLNRYLAVGRTEVTRQDFARFVGATRYAADGCWTFERDRWQLHLDLNWRSPGFPQGDNDPVVCVSWSDAQAYLEWLGHETHQTYRLLSEAEWEYAARAGAETTRPWGVTVERNFANCHGCGSRWDNLGTAPVGSFVASPFGLSDMIGNVAEWVEDCWHDTYDGAPRDGGIWAEEGCRQRVIRGASWRDPPSAARPAHRDRELTDFRAGFIGLRIARSIGQ